MPRCFCVAGVELDGVASGGGREAPGAADDDGDTRTTRLAPAKELVAACADGTLRRAVVETSAATTTTSEVERAHGKEEALRVARWGAIGGWVSGGADGTVAAWTWTWTGAADGNHSDAHAELKWRVRVGGRAEQVYGLAVLPSALVVGVEDDVLLVDPETRMETARHTLAPTAASRAAGAFGGHRNPDHKAFAFHVAVRGASGVGVGVSDGTVRLWDARTLQRGGDAHTTLVHNPATMVSTCAFHDVDEHALVSASGEGSFALWDVRRPAQPVSKCFQVTTNPRLPVFGARFFSGVESKCVVAWAGEVCGVWDLAPGDGEEWSGVATWHVAGFPVLDVTCVGDALVLAGGVDEEEEHGHSHSHSHSHGHGHGEGHSHSHDGGSACRRARTIGSQGGVFLIPHATTASTTGVAELDVASPSFVPFGRE